MSEELRANNIANDDITIESITEDCSLMDMFNKKVGYDGDCQNDCQNEHRDMQSDFQSDMQNDCQNNMQSDFQSANPRKKYEEKYGKIDLENMDIEKIYQRISSDKKKRETSFSNTVPENYYAVSDSSGLIGVFSTLMDVCLVFDRFKTIKFIVQKFDVVKDKPTKEVWVVLYKNVNAVAYLSNDRDAALKIQEDYGRVGFTYDDDIDNWKISINSIIKLEEDRLDMFNRINDLYANMSDEELAKFQMVNQQKLTEMSKPITDGPLSRLLRQMEKITIMDCINIIDNDSVNQNDEPKEACAEALEEKSDSAKEVGQDDVQDVVPNVDQNPDESARANLETTEAKENEQNVEQTVEQNVEQNPEEYKAKEDEMNPEQNSNEVTEAKEDDEPNPEQNPEEDKAKEAMEKTEYNI